MPHKALCANLYRGQTLLLEEVGNRPHTVLSHPRSPIFVPSHLYLKHTSCFLLPHARWLMLLGLEAASPQSHRCSHAWNPGLGSAGLHRLQLGSLPAALLISGGPAVQCHTVAPSGKLTLAWVFHGLTAQGLLWRAPRMPYCNPVSQEILKLEGPLQLTARLRASTLRQVLLTSASLQPVRETA